LSAAASRSADAPINSVSMRRIPRGWGCRLWAIAYMGLPTRAIVCVFMRGNYIFSIRDRGKG
jgi:hypothetical protein